MAQRHATVSDITALFPATAGADSAVLEAWLDATEPLISLAVWGTLASQAHACLAAHNAAVAGAFASVPGAAGEIGPITLEANGPASRQYAPPAFYADGTEALYTGSPYGRKYIEFRRQIIGRGVAIISNMRSV
jgi:hypothetical protein